MKFPELKNTSLIWISLIVIITIMTFIRPMITDFEIISLIAVIIHLFVVIFVFATIPLKIRSIFIWAFIARVIFLLWDINARDIFELPNSGSDTEVYFYGAMKVSDDLSLLGKGVRGGSYSKIIGILFYIIGPQRLFAQYLNVLLGLWVVVVVYKTLHILDIDTKITRIIVLLAAFFPNSMVMSAIMLREIIPTFFVALSLFYFIKWYKWGGYYNTLISLIMLAFAAVFHSGILGLFAGYSFFYLFYKRERNRFSFSFQTIFTFILVGGFTFFTSTQFGDFLFIKFKGAEELEDVYMQANRRLGDSAYLSGITINTLGQLILYGPVKAFYFLTSPLPMNWRGFMDLFTFVFDSLLYFITIFFIIRNWNLFFYRKTLIVGLILTLLGVSFIFGIGVGNAGTAVRHRQKIVPLVLIILAVIFQEKRDNYFLRLIELQNEIGRT